MAHLRGQKQRNRRTGKTKTKEKTPDKHGKSDKEKEEVKEEENVMETPKMGPQIPIPGLGILHLNAKSNTK